MISNCQKITLFFGLIMSQTAWSSNYLLVIGAGGEDKDKQTTIFDQSIKDIADYTKRSPGIKVNVALNGGHAVTQEIINSQFPENAEKSHFLEADYKRLIAKYKAMLENNEMVSGDQFMIYVNGHGALKQNEFDSHSIATSANESKDYNTLKGAELVDLDQLKILRDLAKKKGVKMAIFDGSCHSGNSQALADENTCVVSGSGPNHFAYGPFSENFAKALQKGKNLEEVFLEARDKDDTPAFPMISTPASQSVTALLYEKMTPYFYHFDEHADKMVTYLEENRSNQKICMAYQNFNSLIETINFAESINTVTSSFFWTTKTKLLDLTHLKDLLTQYKNSMEIAALKMQELDNQLKFDHLQNLFQTNYNENYSLKELLTTDFDKLIQDSTNRLTLASTNSEREKIKGNISFYNRAKEKRNLLLRDHPELSFLKDKQEEIAKSTIATYYLNSEIALEERKLYKALYENAQKSQAPTTGNACQNFKL